MGKSYLNSHVFELDNILSHEECDALIAESEDIGYEEADIQALDGPSFHKDVRNNDRIRYENEELKATLWQRIAPYAPKEFKGSRLIAVNEQMRFYRYQAGQKFDWHKDGRFTNSRAQVNQFSLLIYLNDTFEGGATSFTARNTPYDFDDFSLKPVKGNAVAFYHKITHRGDKVLSGHKYILRTDIMYELIGFE